MVLFVILLVCSIILFFVAYNYLVTWSKFKQSKIVEEHKKIVDQASRLEAERRELGSELADLEKKLTFLKHDIAPSANLGKGISLPDDDSTPDTRMGDFMLTQGMISIEQHLKALKMVAQLKMDIAAVCHSLGFIDSDQAKAVKKQIK